MNQVVAIQQPRERKTQRPFVLAALVLAMFMAAIEMTIVSTAMPHIVGELGGFSLYSWVFSSFLLMQSVMTPIYGKLSDLFGRKPIFIIGVVIFLTGSILCGFANSMISLVIFRLIQGFGAGAVQPIAMTIVGDMYTLHERAKIQGYFSSVFGISSVIGPLVGGFIVQYAHWSWIFWINIPIGLLAVVGIVMFLHEDIEHHSHTIDYVGSALFFIAITALMITLIEGGVTWSWSSAPIITLVVIFIVGTILFVVRQQRAAEPMMPLHIWKIRLIMVANLASFTSGALVIGLTSFLPTYIEVVMGKTAIVGGFALTVMTVGWPIAALAAGHLVIRIGPRPVAVIGGVATFLGSLFFVTLDPSRGPVWASIGSFIIGLGMGLTSAPFMIMIQNSVEWQMRGVATASNMFMRMLGSSVGAALLGGVLNTKLATFLSGQSNSSASKISVNTVDQLLSTSGVQHTPTWELHTLVNGLTIGLHTVYWWVFALAVMTMVGTLFLPQLRQQN